MSTSDEFANIEARLTQDENEYAGGVIDQNARDRRYLLTRVREQQARLDAVAKMVDQAEMHGKTTLDVQEVRAAIENALQR